MNDVNIVLLLLLALAAVEASTGVRVVEDERCRSLVDVRALVAGWQPPALDDDEDAVVVVVASRYAPTMPLTLLYRESESTLSRRIAAIVTVECGAGRLALRFGAFDTLLGCSIERVRALTAGVDTLESKTRVLLAELAGWHRERACALPSDYVRAGIFWLALHALLSLIVYANCCRRCRRRSEAEH